MSERHRQSPVNLLPGALQPRRRPEDRLPIRLLKALDALFTRVYHRLHLPGPCPVPAQGPAILACNHTCGLDPLLIQAACPRLVVWMMAREYYNIRWLNWGFRLIDAIPVDRAARDMGATRSALRALEAGRVLGVFPEGRIETAGDLLPFQVGVALLAIRTGAPVYPAYLDGTQRGKDILRAIFTPNKVTLRFGPEVVFPRQGAARQNLQDAAQAIRQAVQKLRDMP